MLVVYKHNTYEVIQTLNKNERTVYKLQRKYCKLVTVKTADSYIVKDYLGNETVRKKPETVTKQWKEETEILYIPATYCKEA